MSKHHWKNGQWDWMEFGLLCLEARRRVRAEGGWSEVFSKPCSACHGTRSNPVIKRNGADEVETKMRSGAVGPELG